MSKKNNDFDNSPFKKLKGLSLPVRDDAKVSVSPLQSEVVKEFDFSVEMKGLGVKILPADERHADVEASRAEPIVTAAKSVVSEPRNDRELFLSAIQGMEVVFADEIPDLEVPTASPRRLKLVEQGRMHPADRLDLHGLTRSEARSRTAHFLENSLHHGHSLVLIITGWGKHSTGEAILRDEICRYLRNEAAPFISEWAIAPKSLGGDGALLVFLRGRTKTS